MHRNNSEIDKRTDEVRVLFTYPFYPDIHLLYDYSHFIDPTTSERTNTPIDLLSIKVTYLHTALQPAVHTLPEPLNSLLKLQHRDGRFNLAAVLDCLEIPPNITFLREKFYDDGRSNYSGSSTSTYIHNYLLICNAVMQYLVHTVDMSAIVILCSSMLLYVWQMTKRLVLTQSPKCGSIRNCSTRSPVTTTRLWNGLQGTNCSTKPVKLFSNTAQTQML